MNFMEIAQARQSCRKYTDKPVEDEKINAVMEAARLAPSACNGQSYHFTVCKGEKAREAAKLVTGLGMNKFAAQAPVLILVSGVPYVKTAALGSKLKGLDYRAMDIGIAAAYLTAEATVQGLDTCILGWVNGEKLQKLAGAQMPVQMVITLGYGCDPMRKKIRKDLKDLVTVLD